jgi:hypothetical protein
MIIFVLMGFALLLIPLAAMGISARREWGRFRGIQPDHIPPGRAISNDISMDRDRRRRYGIGDD